MDGSTRTCVLHTGDEITDTLKLFDNNSWKKVKYAAEQRRYWLKTSKFHNVQLPGNYDDTICYHTQCYKDFTAVPKQSDITQAVESQPARLLRTHVEHPKCSTSGVYEPVCLFCNNFTKRVGKDNHESLSSLELQSSVDNIKDAATKLQDHVLLAKISGQDMIAKQAKVHHTCRRVYLQKAKKSGTDKASCNAAFETIQLHVKHTLVESEGAEKLVTLYKRYTDALEAPDTPFTSQYMYHKLLKVFKGKLKTCKSSKKHGLIIYNGNLTSETAVNIANFDDKSVKEVAQYLRTQIISNVSPTEPELLSDYALNEGQCAVPPILSTFFRVLYTGSDTEPQYDRDRRLIKSVCDDVIFATTHGRTKPSKHVCLGLGIKSLTGSRRVLEILNRLGHSISYHTAETVETQLATNIADINTATPDGLLQRPGLLTSVAWDNYDENIETLSGSNTVHDTVGICYQIIPSNAEPEPHVHISESKTEVSPAQSTLTRKLILKDQQLEPYKKKPRISVFEYQVKDIPRPRNLSTVIYRDILWMMSLALSDSTPMWNGWNSLVTEDPLPRHNIAYMDNISLPPTRLDVIAETLRQSQRVANECGDDYIVVHYDLAVAKPAMQIQAAETPLYDNVFICFGPFHILLAYFACLGYLIDGSGGPEILTETGVLTAGALHSFISGKHYNRCKRLHPLLATAFQVLHFRSFLENTGSLPRSLQEDMEKLADDPSAELLTMIEASEDYEAIMLKYVAYRDCTLTGEHGSTARFWAIYISLVDIYRKFSRACRTNDIDLFVHALSEMCPLFFAAHRPNYARWMVRYLLNLINIDHSHPGVRQILAGGAFTIRRTEKAFSRTAIDLTLEQTVNADAASRATGITAFGNSESARRRWMVTRSARSAIVGNLLEKAGLKSTEDVTKEVKPHRIKKDNSDLNTLVNCIENMMNPFAQEPDDRLYCITTGKQTPDEIKTDLLDCVSKGDTWCNEFIDGCFADASRFEKPIKRRKVKNFAAGAVTTKITVKDQKVMQLQGTRDLFGRLLYISTVEQIDLSKVFAYPLTHIPLSLAHIDGSMNKTDKAKLMHNLEAFGEAGTVPKSVDVTLVDAGLLLHTLQNVPQAFGDISSTILNRLCSMSERVDFICDTYITPTIKEPERVRRGADGGMAFQVTGADQKRPKDWQKALASSAFKTALLQFLAVDWHKDAHADVLNGHVVTLAHGSTCYRFTEDDGRVKREALTDMQCEHEEADTRLIFHLANVFETCPDRTVSVRSNDTDVLVLLLYHVAKLRPETVVWMDAGLSGNNTRRSINITSILQKIDTTVIEALPALHAFTGSDYTSSFMNKGKIKPFDLVRKSSTYSKTFAQLGETDTISDDGMSSIEAFVCALYGRPKMTKVDDVRYALFQQSYAPSDNTDPLQKIKGINPSSMPPCYKVLQKKIMRANLVAARWKGARKQLPTSYNPEDYGWELRNGAYCITWFSGDQVPRSVCDVLEIGNVDNANDENESIPTHVNESDESDESD